MKMLWVCLLTLMFHQEIVTIKPEAVKMWHFISDKISETIQSDFVCDDIRPVAGGDTHEAFRISDGRKRFFVKINNLDAEINFHSEALGLMQLAKNTCVRLPKYICDGCAEDKSYLVLQHINFKDGNDAQWQVFGSNLAQLHRQNSHELYGCKFNNYIGHTPQLNTMCNTWSDFFAENRIGHMLHLLANQGIRFVDIDAAVDHIKVWLKDHTPLSSMLHGDLWRGNIGFFKEQGVIFDPAFYYGDRETDIAMTELFGRLPSQFYEAYNNSWPLDEGYKERKPLYQLYHILNHALMFGGHYMQSARDTLQKISKI